MNKYYKIKVLLFKIISVIFLLLRKIRFFNNKKSYRFIFNFFMEVIDFFTLILHILFVFFLNKLFVLDGLSSTNSFFVDHFLFKTDSLYVCFLNYKLDLKQAAFLYRKLYLYYFKMLNICSFLFVIVKSGLFLKKHLLLKTYLKSRLKKLKNSFSVFLVKAFPLFKRVSLKEFGYFYNEIILIYLMRYENVLLIKNRRLKFIYYLFMLFFVFANDFRVYKVLSESFRCQLLILFFSKFLVYNYDEFLFKVLVKYIRFKYFLTSNSGVSVLDLLYTNNILKK